MLIMRVAIKTVLRSCLMVCVLSTTVSGQVIFQNDFDQHSRSIDYTRSELDKGWNEPTWENGVDEGRVRIVSGEKAYGQKGSALAVSYPSGTFGTKQSGAQWILKLGHEYEEATLKYRIKFESGFDFVRGGKLPGLAGGNTPTGSDPVNGVDGWSARFMWKTDKPRLPGSSRRLTAYPISYAKYLKSGKKKDGSQADRAIWYDSNRNRSVFKSGVWYSIRQRVKMNDPGVANGVFQIWLNEQLVLDQQDRLVRLTPKLKIDSMYFSTFFGGGDKQWATSKDETIYFDDFEITASE